MQEIRLLVFQDAFTERGILREDKAQDIVSGKMPIGLLDQAVGILEKRKDAVVDGQQVVVGIRQKSRQGQVFQDIQGFLQTLLRVASHDLLFINADGGQ